MQFTMVFKIYAYRTTDDESGLAILIWFSTFQLSIYIQELKHNVNAILCFDPA